VSAAFDQAGHVPTGWVAAILVGVLLSAYVASWIGLAAIFGAFVMGLILPRRADLTQEVTRRLEDLVVTVLLPLFFVVTGLRVQLGLLDRPALWLLTVALLGVAVAGKWLGATVAARYAGLRMQESMALGALMNTRGLTELIVVTVGLNYGVVSPALFTMLVLVALVTTFMAGPALRLIDPGRQLSVPPEEELQAAPTVRQADVDGPLPKRSILIAPMDDQNLDPLVALAEPLAHAQPPHGVILARLLQPPQAATGGPIAGQRELAAASRTFERRRDELAGGGIAARAMACISPDPGQASSNSRACRRSTWSWWTVVARSSARASLEVIRGPALPRHPPMSRAWSAQGAAFPTSAPTVRSRSPSGAPSTTGRPWNWPVGSLVPTAHPSGCWAPAVSPWQGTGTPPARWPMPPWSSSS
jgi:Sodium/hydrogen exchanger family